jgi:hypothetical protein
MQGAGLLAHRALPPWLKQRPDAEFEAETGVPVRLPPGVHGEVAAQIANALRS